MSAALQARERMLERAKIADSKIVALLESRYGLLAARLEFLPVGNDARAWSFRAKTSAGDYFLKLRAGGLNPASLCVPHHLRGRGLRHVVAPIATRAGDLSAPLGDYRLIVYPYIEGRSHWAMPLSPAQWRAWGGIMRQIHETPVSPELDRALPREAFGAKWLSTMTEVESAMADPAGWRGAAADLASLWRANRSEIERARQRYQLLGGELAGKKPRLVVCHADIHRANIIIAGAGEIHIVDWDETLLAPPERDLMFFLGDGHAEASEAAFLEGYGDCAPDALALAYYRYDWALQEFADYGERVFLAADQSAAELAFARDEFERLFAPGDVVERAGLAFARLEAFGAA